MTVTQRRHDVAILTDFRYPGGTSGSTAEEIRAQAAAGLSTVLIQARSPHVAAGSSFNSRIVARLLDGHAELALSGDPVSARVLVIRQPRIFTGGIPPLPPIEADEVVMVLNQSPRDPGRGIVYYDVDEIRELVEGRFGERVHWVCISPAVRHEVLAVSPGFPLAGFDWPAIIEVAEWRVDRSRPVGAIPVIGRHSRPDPMKWPRSAEEILAAYPATPDVKVRILGGAEHAVRRVGRKASSWEVLPFGAVPVRAFLSSIDFFVYFHDSSCIEAFGRVVLEAMASGAPSILPSTYEPTFGDAALYATPSEVPDLVHSLYKDWDRYLDLSARSVDYVEQRFSPRSHIARLAGLGVVPADAARCGPALDRTRHAATRVQRCPRPASRSVSRVPRRQRNQSAAVKRTVHGLGSLARLLIRDPLAGASQVVRGLLRRIRAKRAGRPVTRTYLAFGVDVDELAALTRSVAQAALVAGNQVPLIVTDCAGSTLAGDSGVALEYVPDSSGWQAFASDTPRGRLARIPVQRARVSTTAVSPGAIPDLRELLAGNSTHLGNGSDGR